ncbi:MAG: FeoB-associated Cys-rich membrane protein [Prevotella sp.]|nr:FeoB-associated Cys-rich membrane protein [Prevotella sp.]
MQIFIVTVIVAAAVGYAGWRIYAALQQDSNPCAGCNGCELRKKSGKKFCQYK